MDLSTERLKRLRKRCEGADSRYCLVSCEDVLAMIEEIERWREIEARHEANRNVVLKALR